MDKESLKMRVLKPVPDWQVIYKEISKKVRARIGGESIL